MPTPASPEQIRIASRLDLKIDRDSFEVAAAQILDGVAEALGEDPPSPATEKQQTFAGSLGVDVSSDTKRVASARIDDALRARTQEALRRLNLATGDIVTRVTRFQHGGEWHVIEKEFVVSSIHESGRVYFKGGRGQSAWPSQLRKKATS